MQSVRAQIAVLNINYFETKEGAFAKPRLQAPGLGLRLMLETPRLMTEPKPEPEPKLRFRKGLALAVTDRIVLSYCLLRSGKVYKMYCEVHVNTSVKK